MTEVFLDEPAHPTLLWKFKTFLFRIVARRSCGIITNSSGEIQSIARRFRTPQSRCRFVPLCSTLPPVGAPVPGEGFILAAGRSGRDYETLLAAAPEIKMPIVIICGRDDLPGKSSAGPVTILRDAGRETYLNYLRRCSLVIIPLKPLTRSIGQVVALEAMSLGKPIIASRTAGMTDYIQDGITGAFVEPEQPGALAKKTAELLAQPALMNQMGANAVRCVTERYSCETHAALKLEAIASLQAAETPAIEDTPRLNRSIP
jgi:glycosyltransferase involved in cell wall biosynthesis